MSFCAHWLLFVLLQSASRPQAVITAILNYMTEASSIFQQAAALSSFAIHLKDHPSYCRPAEDSLELSDQIKKEALSDYPSPHLAIHFSARPTGLHSDGNQSNFVNTFLWNGEQILWKYTVPCPSWNSRPCNSSVFFFQAGPAWRWSFLLWADISGLKQPDSFLDSFLDIFVGFYLLVCLAFSIIFCALALTCYFSPFYW